MKSETSEMHIFSILCILGSSQDLTPSSVHFSSHILTCSYLIEKSTNLKDWDLEVGRSIWG